MHRVGFTPGTIDRHTETVYAALRRFAEDVTLRARSGGLQQTERRGGTEIETHLAIPRAREIKAILDAINRRLNPHFVAEPEHPVLCTAQELGPMAYDAAYFDRAAQHALDTLSKGALEWLLHYCKAEVRQTNQELVSPAFQFGDGLPAEFSAWQGHVAEVRDMLCGWLGFHCAPFGVNPWGGTQQWAYRWSTPKQRYELLAKAFQAYGGEWSFNFAQGNLTPTNPPVSTYVAMGDTASQQVTLNILDPHGGEFGVIHNLAQVLSLLWTALYANSGVLWNGSTGPHLWRPFQLEAAIGGPNDLIGYGCGFLPEDASAFETYLQRFMDAKRPAMLPLAEMLAGMTDPEIARWFISSTWAHGGRGRFFPGDDGAAACLGFEVRSPDRQPTERMTRNCFFGIAATLLGAQSLGVRGVELMPAALHRQTFDAVARTGFDTVLPSWRGRSNVPILNVLRGDFLRWAEAGAEYVGGTGEWFDDLSAAVEHAACGSIAVRTLVERSMQGDAKRWSATLMVLQEWIASARRDNLPAHELLGSI